MVESRLVQDMGLGWCLKKAQSEEKAIAESHGEGLVERLLVSSLLLVP